jgi:hypothetical protein
MRRTRKNKLILRWPDGRDETVSLPVSVAFVAARAIAQRTHADPVLCGEFGTAEFKSDGSGSVLWNSDSTMPGTTTAFDTRTIVCI